MDGGKAADRVLLAYSLGCSFVGIFPYFDAEVNFFEIFL